MGDGPALNEERIEELTRENEHLRRGLRTRPRIEHAVGMLMWLVRCDEAAAFEALSYLSQNTNRKVVDLADLFAAVAEGRRRWPDDVHALLRDLISDPEQAGSGRR